MLNSMYFDRSGNPIGLLQWAQLCDGANGHDYARVEQWRGEAVTIEGKWYAHLWVSTVWIGINLRFSDGPPLIFETMVFVEDGPTIEGAMRYSTEREAREGHRRIVESLDGSSKAPFVWVER